MPKMTGAAHTAVHTEGGAAERRAFRVSGIVQGVGYRPFVYRLAEEYALSGWVLNDSAGVGIEAEGTAAALDAFAVALADDHALWGADVPHPAEPRGDAGSDACIA